MSIFNTQDLACPSCGKAVQFAVVESIAADRRPDLRESIVDGSFQRENCAHCSEPFRAPPQIVYMDMELRLWALVRPVETRGELAATEEKARQMFEAAFGAKAPPIARRIGASLRRRVTFGWAALREKLLCARHQLDDLELELTKLAVMRSSGRVSLDTDLEFRLDRVEDAWLLLVWITSGEERAVSGLRVPRAVYDEVASNRDAWEPLRRELSAGSFVDIGRFLIPSETTSAGGAAEGS